MPCFINTDLPGGTPQFGKVCFDLASIGQIGRKLIVWGCVPLYQLGAGSSPAVTSLHAELHPVFSCGAAPPIFDVRLQVGNKARSPWMLLYRLSL